MIREKVEGSAPVKQSALSNIDFSSVQSAMTVTELQLARVAEERSLIEVIDSVTNESWNIAVNRLQDLVISQAIQICEQSMAEAGMGESPVPFAFVLFGSGGRGEATLWSDQDNGIIYADHGGEEATSYFTAFGSKIAEMLEQIGYPPCEGKVMASNEKWQQSLSGWSRMIESWRENLSWEAVRYLTIVADMRYVAGDKPVALQARERMMQQISQEVELEKALIGNTMRHKAALNVLGQVITERFGDYAGGFDVKYALYVPLVNGIRCLSLIHGITETSTMNRIDRLSVLEIFPQPWTAKLRSAFLSALRFRAMASSYAVDQGEREMASFLRQEEMKDKDVRKELRESLITVKQLYRMLQKQQRHAGRRRI